jgi:hypothetical protein
MKLPHFFKKDFTYGLTPYTPSMIQKLPEDSFCWIRWRESDIPHFFNIACRTYDLVRSKELLRTFAIGYTDAETLRCRPKVNHKAVMFLKDDTFFWFHLTNNEFDKIFQDNWSKS